MHCGQDNMPRATRRNRRGAPHAGHLLAALLGFFCLSPATSMADKFDDVDHTKLANVLGIATPTGSGVPISQVEASNVDGAYYPVKTHSEFTAGTDPFSVEVDFDDGSGGESNGTTSHATTTVGRNFYGNTFSMAPGANAVTIYSAGDWLDNVLNMDNGKNPLTESFRVQNFSWIASFADPNVSGYLWKEHPSNVNALQRFDYAIDNANSGEGMTAVVGLNNNTNPLPYLLSYSYNAIAVGRTDGVHSSGPTQSPAQDAYGPDRTKPDLVAPTTSTSAGTAFVSSAAAMMYEPVAGTDAVQQSETMKALLLAGATKEEIPGWSNTEMQPLDSHFGAGELNVYNSYLMKVGGQTAGSTDGTGAAVNTVDTSGWDYRTFTSCDDPCSDDLYYNFEVPSDSTATELSIVMAWNVEVTDTSPGMTFSGSESLANLDMRLYDSTGSFLDSLVMSSRPSESISTVDNVEHIYQTNLGSGTYTLKVSGDSTRDFGLAWRLNLLRDEPSADFNEDNNIDGADFLAWQGGVGTLLGATLADGDADGDGDVDSDDLAVLEATFGAAAVLLSAVSVPEPGTLVLLMLTAALLLTLRRRGRGYSQLA